MKGVDISVLFHEGLRFSRPDREYLILFVCVCWGGPGGSHLESMLGDIAAVTV